MRTRYYETIQESLASLFLVWFCLHMQNERRERRNMAETRMPVQIKGERDSGTAWRGWERE